jgi:hypothetical protein
VDKSLTSNKKMNKLQRLKAKIEFTRNSLRSLLREWLESVGETSDLWMEDGTLTVMNWDD